MYKYTRLVKNNSVVMINSIIYVPIINYFNNKN